MAACQVLACYTEDSKPKKKKRQTEQTHLTQLQWGNLPACWWPIFVRFLLMTATLPANREKEEKSGTHYNSTWLKYYPKAVAKSSNWQLPNVKQVPNQKKKGSNKFKQIPPSPNCTIKRKVLLIRMQWQM